MSAQRLRLPIRLEFRDPEGGPEGHIVLDIKLEGGQLVLWTPADWHGPDIVVERYPELDSWVGRLLAPYARHPWACQWFFHDQDAVIELLRSLGREPEYMDEEDLARERERARAEEAFLKRRDGG